MTTNRQIAYATVSAVIGVVLAAWIMRWVLDHWVEIKSTIGSMFS
jgi:hypothetical protein